MKYNSINGVFRIFVCLNTKHMSELKTLDNDENINPSEHLRKLNDQIALEKIAIDQLKKEIATVIVGCLLYTSPSPRDRQKSRMPSSA